MSVFGPTANETPWHASSSQASVFCSATAQRAPGCAGRPPEYLCKWAATAQVFVRLSDNIACSAVSVHGIR